MQYLEN